MCVARREEGATQNKAELFTSEFLAKTFSEPCVRGTLKTTAQLAKTPASPPPRVGDSSRLKASAFPAPALLSLLVAVVVLLSDVRESQCLEKKKHHVSTARARVEECERCARAHVQVSPLRNGRRGAFRVAALLTYSGSVSRFEGTRWPPFSKPTAFSVKTMDCACAQICCSSARKSACEPAHTDAGGAGRRKGGVTDSFIYFDKHAVNISEITVIITKTVTNIAPLFFKNQYFFRRYSQLSTH